MRYCSYCGTPVLDDAAFCMSCGKQLPQPDSIPSQTDHGTKNPDDGYYEDVLPEDIKTTSNKNQISSKTIKTILLICSSALFVIGICIAFMVVL